MFVSRVILVLFLCILTLAAIDKDLMPSVPGAPDSFKQSVYTGYLNTNSDSRKLHYVFIQSTNNPPTQDPVTLWLNGGPGCSSLLGYLQEIGPFFLEQGARYNVGDRLKENPYSWNKLSNLLFIQSPAGVGFSYSNDANFSYNDISTSEDNMAALLSFFTGFPEYADSPFWIAGESYAGKYIPDLSVLIDFYNNKGVGKKINLKGIMVGNGIMTFQGGSLEKSQVQYMIDHEFIDPQLIPYYQSSCQFDPLSAGCRYFNLRYTQNVDDINPYNVYSYCFYNDSFLGTDTKPKRKYHSQESILKQFIKKGSFKADDDFNGATCAFFDGLVDYFKAHASQYNSNSSIGWNGPCAENITQKYQIDLKGSMPQYRYLLSRLTAVHIALYNGDWDDVVPYTDTIKNLEILNLKESDVYSPFFAQDQHAGFIQLYSGVTFAILKGASHQVPQNKRAEALEFFKMTLNSPRWETS